MNALSRREHSRAELLTKLRQRPGGDISTIESVLDDLAEDGLQSDERFVESLCRSRIHRGYGRLHIVNELRRKGVSPTCYEAVVENLAVDWFDLARRAAAKRFGGGGAEDSRERSSRVRFLQYRGFTHEEIYHALSHLEHP